MDLAGAQVWADAPQSLKVKPLSPGSKKQEGQEFPEASLACAVTCAIWLWNQNVGLSQINYSRLSVFHCPCPPFLSQNPIATWLLSSKLTPL